MTRRPGGSAVGGPAGGAGSGAGGPDDDRRLRELFGALREDDRRALPAFDRVLATIRRDFRGPSRRFTGPGWFWMEVAAFAGALMIVLVALVPWHAHQHAPGAAGSGAGDPLAEALAQARAIDAWQAPTDSLLEVALLKVPDTVPTLEFTSVALPALATPSASDETQGRKR